MTMINDRFSKEDQKAIERYLHSAYRNQPRGKSLSTLIELWDKITKEIETGYRLTTDEYINDMDIRSRIESVQKILSLEGQSILRNLIIKQDELFVKSTKKIQKPVMHRANTSQWWYYRIPKVHTPDFLQGLEDRGVI